MGALGDAQLERWGISPDIAAQAGLIETDNAQAFYPEMPAEPAIVIPYYDPRDGTLLRFSRAGVSLPFARLRWLRPKEQPTKGGFGKPKSQRYLQPDASGLQPYFPPTRTDWLEVFADVRVPIVLTEGEAKAIVGCTNGFVTIAFGGVFSFADRNGELLPLLQLIDWNGRNVYVCYDSDAAHNPQVAAAEARLVDDLQRRRGARCHIVRLPEDGDSKTGLDDFIRLFGPDEFDRLCQSSPSLGALDAKVLSLNRSCAWIEKEGLIYDTETHGFIKKDNFTNGSRFSSVVHIQPGGKTTKTKTISVAATWLKHPHAQRFSQVLFRPGEGVTTLGEDGRPALNMWEGYLEARPGNVQPFFDLNDHVFSRLPPEHQELPLMLAAYKAQNPAEKIQLAIAMVGPQGSGKSLWSACIRDAFAPYGATITAEQLQSNFQTWLERSLVAVINDADADALLQARDRFKSLVTDLEQPMEEKYRPRRIIKSYTFYILNANRRAVSSYEQDDRRMVVVDVPKPRDAAFYDGVLDWLKAGGARHLSHYLQTVDLQGWKPPARAPATSEKLLAYQESLTPVQELANEMRKAEEHTIVFWLKQAEAWAQRAETSNNSSLVGYAKTVRENVHAYSIRPFYTAAELALMFPAVIESTLGSRHNKSTPSGEISRQLRDAGIPYLTNADDPRGFLRNGHFYQYLIVADFDEWDRPITQAEFDRLWGHWPTYRQYINNLRGRSG